MKASRAASSRCAFKIAQNPNYNCPRRGAMYQDQESGYFCSYHDEFSKTRCQAYFEFKGSGMQCSEVHETIDEKTGKQLCAKHGPTSEYSTRRCEAVLVTDSGDYQCPALSTAVDQKSGIRYCRRHYLPSPINDSQDILQIFTCDIDDLKATGWTTERITRWLNGVAPTSPKHLPVNNCQEKLAMIAPQEPVKVAPKLSTSVHETMVLRPSAPMLNPCKLTPDSRANGPSPKQSGSQEDHESRLQRHTDHIAALYALCNICLENHSLTTMRKVEPCGHEFREECLRDLIRGNGVRRFNCSSCARWFQDQQGVYAICS